jgi:hypothetical protein
MKDKRPVTSASKKIQQDLAWPWRAFGINSLPELPEWIAAFEESHSEIHLLDFEPLLKYLKEQRKQLEKAGALSAINYENQTVLYGTAVWGLTLVLLAESLKICKPTSPRIDRGRAYLILRSTVNFTVALIMYGFERPENALEFIKNRFKRLMDTTKRTEEDRRILFKKEELLVSEVAKVFGVHKRTVQRWIREESKEGKLKQAHSHAYIKRQDYLDFALKSQNFRPIYYEYKEFASNPKKKISKFAPPRRGK